MASKTFPLLLFSATLLLLSHSYAGTTSAVKSIYWFSGSGVPSSSINSSLFTHIFCAFADLGPVTYQITISPANSAGFSSFTRTVRQRNPNVKTLLSIGGGSANPANFAAMASQASRRRAFINSSIALARSNGFDGLDLDWEFPSTHTDMANFGTLLLEWRAAVTAESRRARPRRAPLLLTAAVFRSSDYYSINAPARNITNSLDWINVMAYDFYGPGWSKYLAAPPAALYNTTAAQINVDVGIRDWIAAGIPAYKIVLGIPFYGYAWNSTSTGLIGPANGAAISPPFGDLGYGQIKSVVAGSTTWTCVYSTAVVTDYCYNGTTWIGYDDVRSVAGKVRYAKRKRLRGYFAWQVAADSNWILSKTAFNSW